MNGRYSYDGLDRILHEKARLGLLTCLMAHPEGLLFNDLKELCNLTDGNLSRHLQALHQHQIIEIYKNLEQKRPQTLCRISPEGRDKFLAYLEELNRVLQDAEKTARESRECFHLSPEWSPT